MRNKVSRILFKTAPLFLGCLFWYVWGGMHCITRTFTIPVCFYNAPADTTITCPETVTVHLRARRSLVASIDRTELALHIDAKNMHTGPNKIEPNETRLLLPDGIKLVHCNPCNVVAHLAPSFSTQETQIVHQKEADSLL